ncbi:hypothetical protein HGB07_00255 [Candidatus Roizmanbacteria bacterium]|nr:hypothetical protein [Candidatus Roizmanbacteria bacterium]
MKLIAKVFTAFLFVVCMSNISIAEDGYCTGGDIKFMTSAAQVVDGKKVPLYFIQIKNNRSDCGNWPLNNEMWFALDTETGNSMYATALTAFSMGKTVTISTVIPNNYVHASTLTQMTIQN